MKALVVDPDRSARATVKRLLSHVNVDVVEADNGLIALSVLEQSDPDFVVLEIDMPILSGPDCLSAIRQSPVRPDIPVICITSLGSRDNVHRMVALGVADFLLKPINPVDVLPRIKNLLVRVLQWRQRQSGRSGKSLLIVDNDPNFIEFARPLLSTSFELIEAGSSTVAAMSYRDATPKPTVVCLAEGLPLMSEDLLLDVIRRMANEAGANPPQFYLLAKSPEIAPEKAERYAGIVRKSFEPQPFLDEFRRVVAREQSTFERLRHMVHEGLLSEMVTATQQTIGVMIGSEISVLEPEAGDECPEGVVAEVGMVDAESGVSLRTLISSGRAEVERMGSQIVGREITVAEGAGEVLGELASTIAGRIRACLVTRGFDLKVGHPEIRTLEGGAGEGVEYDLAALFRCTSGEVFRVGLFARQLESAPAGQAGGRELSGAAGAVAGPGAESAGEEPKPDVAAAAVQAGQSVDDVLF